MVPIRNRFPPVPLASPLKCPGPVMGLIAIAVSAQKGQVNLSEGDPSLVRAEPPHVTSGNDSLIKLGGSIVTTFPLTHWASFDKEPRLHLIAPRIQRPAFPVDTGLALKCGR